MPYTVARAPAVIDKTKKAAYRDASELTSARGVNAIGSFISTNGVLRSVKKAMQANKTGNTVLSTAKFHSLTDSRIRVVANTVSSAGSDDVFITQYTQGGDLSWIARIGGAGSSDVGYGICTDSNGNINVTGYFSSSTLTAYDKNGNAFGTSLTNAGQNDSFIVQYTSTGFVNWVARIAGLATDNAYGIVTDSNGNITVTGFYSGAVTAYNKDGTAFATLAQVIGYEVFVIQYNSRGFVNWVARLIGSINDQGSAIAVDLNNNIYITGFFPSATLTAYNASNVAFLPTLTNAGTGNDAFVVKYTSTGDVSWLASIAGTSSEQGNGIATDSNGNVTVTGQYLSTTLTVKDASNNTFGTLTNSGNNDTFIVQYTSAGAVNWAARIAGTTSDNANAICTDSNGNINITGVFNSTSLIAYNNDTTPFPTTLTNSTSNEAFVIQYSSTGTVKWVAHIGGISNDAAYGISTDLNGNITVTGVFASTTLTAYNKNNIAFPTTISNTNSGSDIFIVQYNPSGAVNWVARIIGRLTDIPRAVTTDKSGNVIVTGYFNSTPITAFDKNNNNIYFPSI